MANIAFPVNPNEGDIFPVSSTRSFKRIGNAWVIFRNNIPLDSDAAYPFQPPIVALTEPPLPNNNPFWQNGTDGKLYYQNFNEGTPSWQPAFVQVAQAIVTSQDTAPALPHGIPFWHQTTTGIMYYQKTVGAVTTWHAVNAFDKYDLKITTTTGAADATVGQVFKIDNSTATTKTINITNAPANRAAAFVIKITGNTGTIAYTNTITWDGNAQPALGAAFTLVTLFWDGTAFTGSASQKA